MLHDDITVQYNPTLYNNTCLNAAAHLSHETITAR
jgi:hypothetical protein